MRLSTPDSIKKLHPLVTQLIVAAQAEEALIREIQQAVREGDRDRVFELAKQLSQDPEQRSAEISRTKQIQTNPIT